MASIRSGLVLALACLSVAGCVSSSTTQLINTYSTAAGNLDTAVGQTYTEAQQSMSDERIGTALVNPAGVGYDTFTKSTDLTAAARARTQLADKLLSYAKALQTLAADQPATDLTTQSQALLTNLTSLNATIGSMGKAPPLTKTDLAILTTVVDAIGQTWIQSERLKLLTQLVEKADPVVQAASQLYVKDLGDWEKMEITDLNDTAKNYFQLAQAKASGAGVDPATFQDPNTRMTLLQKADALRAQAAALPAKYKSLADAMTKCAQAHQAVVASLKSDASLKASTDVVSQFKASVEQVYTFYKGATK